MFFLYFSCFSNAFKHPFSTVINKKNMIELIGNKKAAVVHFYAPECPHCADLAPTWNELSRMYNVYDNVTFGTINCDRYRSICSQYDGSSTPTTKFYPPHAKLGEVFAGDMSVMGFAKWLRNHMGFNPYTAPNHLCYAKKGEIDEILKKNAVFVVVDHHKKSSFNQTEIRQCEEKRNVDIRALDPHDHADEAKKYCSDLQPCMVLIQNDKQYKYEGPITKESILEFFDQNLEADL